MTWVIQANFRFHVFTTCNFRPRHEATEEELAASAGADGQTSVKEVSAVLKLHI